MAEGKVFGDPDDAERSKAKALIEFGKWFKRACGKNTAPGITQDGRIDIYWWIDWACTDQDNPGPDMAALPAYAAVCHSIFAAWNDVYKDRVRAARPPPRSTARTSRRPPLPRERPSPLPRRDPRPVALPRGAGVVPGRAAHFLRLHVEGRHRLGGAARVCRRRDVAAQGGRGGGDGRPPRKRPADQPWRSAHHRVVDRRGLALDSLLVLAHLHDGHDAQPGDVLFLQRVPLLPVLRA